MPSVAPASPVVGHLATEGVGNQALVALFGDRSWKEAGGNRADELDADKAAEAVISGQPTTGRAGTARSPWIPGGSPLPTAERDVLESALGADLSNVRVYNGSLAKSVVHSMNARAVTFGPHVFLGPNEKPSDRRLMAHEVAHVLQQSAPGAAPRLAAKRADKSRGEAWFEWKLARIEDLLSYGLIDWAVTDAEAIEALALLESMSHVERTTAISHIDVRRLAANLPGSHQRRLEVITSETRTGVADSERIHGLLSYGALDWAITDKEASEALALIEDMPPEQRMHALMGINRQRLFENLPTESQKSRLSELWTHAHAKWLRARQQRDPLEPGDAVQVHVWNAIGGKEATRFSFRPSYTVDDDYNLDLPFINKVSVRGLRPSDIEKRLTALLADGYLRAPVVNVEVLRRRSESFDPRPFPKSVGEAPRDTKLAPGDTVEVRVLETTTWTEQSSISGNFQVDRSGRLRFKHLGLVEAAGLTKAALKARMLSLLTGWYKRTPTVWIFITSHAGRIYLPPPGLRPRPNKTSADEAAKREARFKHYPARRAVDQYLDFARAKAAELAGPELSTSDKRVGREALTRFLDWLDANNEEGKLAATSPWEVWGRVHTPLLIAAIEREPAARVRKEIEERRTHERDAAVEAKLDEFWTWARARWRESGVKFRSLGPAHLLTENPLRQKGMDTLTNAVLSWAHANTSDPDFLKRSPSEVAAYLVARDPHLAAIVDLADKARPLVEYFPELDRTRYTMGELAVETLVGIIPIIGDATDADAALSGVTLTGHKLTRGDRVLTALGAIIPFVPGSALRAGKKLPEVVENVAKTTGRTADEIYAVFRVAGHLDKVDVRDLERIIAAVNDGKHLSKADLQILDNIALKLKGPLEEAAGYLAKGKKIPIGRLRADIVTGTRFVPGTVRHKAQRWIEYQFRHPEVFSRISGKIDPKWEKLYDGIIKNHRAGGAFERAVLGNLKYEKNTAMMMPKLGAKLPGFIPDAVRGNPAELVWGKAYHFTEVKGWKKMSDTGNLKAMLDYVERFGGHIELVFRSGKHADGLTEISRPLQRRLDKLAKAKKVTIVRYP